MTKNLRALAVLLLLSQPAWAGGVLRVGMADDPDQLDPAMAGTYTSRVVFMAMCDKLIDLSPDLKFVPQLATSWAWSDDARALTLKLRAGVSFQDGTAMTADAVKANLDRYRTAPESVRKGELRSVSAVEVIDPLTVRLVLSQPYAPLLAVLADRAGMMASPAAFQKLGRDFASAPACSGPFRLTERVAQDRIVLDRFPGYWNAGAITLDRVVFRPIADTTVRLVNLQTGQLDMLMDLAPSDAAKVRADAGLALTAVPALGYAAVQFNVGNGPRADTPFGHDPRVRAAFEAALDRGVINQVVLEGLFLPNNQTELPSGPYYNTQIPLPPRDLLRARALLKEAGAEHPVLELRMAKTPRDVQVGEVIQALAAEAGIDVKLAPGETLANIDAMNKGDFQAHVTVWSGRADPDLNLAVFLSCDSFQDWGKYCSPAFEAAMAAARAEVDPVRRAALYRDVTAIYLKDRPMLPLYNLTWLFAASRRVHGFTAVPDGLIRFGGVSIQ